MNGAKRDEREKSGMERFFSTTLWQLDPDAYVGYRRYLVKYGQIGALVCKDFWDDQCFLRASALTYTTILSLVPFFALTFALLKGLGVQNTLEPFILEQVAAGSEEVVDRIITYISNTEMASVGAIGLVTLVITVIALLGNIEETFNVVWGVKETRSFYRKFSDYLSVVVSGPLLLLAAISVTTSLQSQTVVQWIIRNTYLGDVLLNIFLLVPYLSIWAALIFLYIFIPNTKVRFRSALVGGVLAGTIWQIAQWGYIHFQVGVARYNAIYGTLALLPIFMVWIYASWLIVLFGVEVVYAHQNIRTFRHEIHNLALSSAARERLALAVMLEIAAAFHLEAPPWSSERLASELGIPVRVVNDILGILAGAGYLAEVAGEEPAYQPARPLEHIEVGALLETLRNHGEPCASEREFRGAELVRDLIARMEAGGRSALAGMTMHDLVTQLSGPEALQGTSGRSDCPVVDKEG